MLFKPQTLHCGAALIWASLATAVCAQTPAPASAPRAGASAPAAAPQPAYSVYRWITLQADKPRKTDNTPKARPKTEVATPAPRKPEAQPAPAIIERVEPEVAATPAPEPEPTMAAQPVSTPASAPEPVQIASVAAPAVVEEEVPLHALSQPEPDIPRSLRDSGTGGKVMLSFTVQPDGSVADAAVVSSSNRRLNRPAIDAVSQWRFAPIRVARATQVEIEFNLQ